MADEKRIVLSGFDDSTDIELKIKSKETDATEMQKQMKADLDFCMAMEGAVTD